MPPLALGGSAAAGQLLIDQALAEQMALDWHEDEERGPQPEDEPTEEACSAEKFSIGTPQCSVLALPAPEGRGHDLILPGDRRRESPRTPNRGPRRKSEREQQRAARRPMDDHSWIHASTLEHASQSWTPQKQSLAREIHELRLTNKDQSRELARALERSQQLEVSLTASNRGTLRLRKLG